MTNKKELIKEVKKGFNYIRLLEFKKHIKIIKMLSEFTIKDLKEIIMDNDIEIMNIKEEIRSILKNNDILSHSKGAGYLK